MSDTTDRAHAILREIVEHEKAQESNDNAIEVLRRLNDRHEASIIALVDEWRQVTGSACDCGALGIQCQGHDAEVK